MMKSKYTFAAALILSCASLSAMAASNDVSLSGDPAPASARGRIVKIDANTNYVNVTEGESVQLVADNGQSAAWTFNNPFRSQVKLQEILPAGSLDHPVMAYVHPGLEDEAHS